MSSECNDTTPSPDERPRLYHDRIGRCKAHQADVCEVCPGASLEARLAPLREIGQLIRDQDGRATAHPIFLVQQRRRVYGLDSMATDDTVWLVNGEGEADADLAMSLEAGWKESRHEPNGYSRVGYCDEWDFVTAFFSEVGARHYIRANRHNLCDPRTYVATGYRNLEWQLIREFLLWLAAEPAASDTATEEPAVEPKPGAMPSRSLKFEARHGYGAVMDGRFQVAYVNGTTTTEAHAFARLFAGAPEMRALLAKILAPGISASTDGEIRALLAETE